MAFGYSIFHSYLSQIETSCDKLFGFRSNRNGGLEWSHSLMKYQGRIHSPVESRPMNRPSLASSRRFTVGDWIIRSDLLLPPRPVRMTQQQRDAEEILATGRTFWCPVPKDKHILRMYISAALSVFSDVMRPHLEKKLGRLLNTFAETVEEILPFWDALSRESQLAWARRAKDVKVQNHYIYLRITTQPKQQPKKVKEPEVEDYDTDPDELPGEVCSHETQGDEEEGRIGEVEVDDRANQERPMNWVTGGRHLLQRKASTTVN